MHYFVNPIVIVSFSKSRHYRRSIPSRFESAFTLYILCNALTLIDFLFIRLCESHHFAAKSSREQERLCLSSSMRERDGVDGAMYQDTFRRRLAVQFPTFKLDPISCIPYPISHIPYPASRLSRKGGRHIRLCSLSKSKYYSPECPQS